MDDYNESYGTSHCAGSTGVAKHMDVRERPLTHFLVTPVEHSKRLCTAFNYGI